MIVIGYLFLLAGVLILILATLGLYVFNDALSRQHAATKAGSLGIVFVACGAAFFVGEWSWLWRVVVIVAIVWATMPVASHVLARAALHEGTYEISDRT